jgi:hypothetical protein
MAAAIEFDDAARSEYHQALDWYSRRSTNAAKASAADVDAAITKIAGELLSWQLHTRAPEGLT